MKGKSLSLICGSLTWLRDHKSRVRAHAFEDKTSNADEPDWVLEHERKKRRNDARERKREIDARLAKVRANEERSRQRYESGEPKPKRQKIPDQECSSSEAEGAEAFLLDDYESDLEGARAEVKNDGLSGLSAETLALLERAGGLVVKDQKDDDIDEDETKIFFCSRTHSQLSQFVNELRRVQIPSSDREDPEDVPPDESGGLDATIEPVKQLTLGSRKNLCINSKVSKLNSVTAINEKCLELQQAKTPKDAKCPYLPNKDNQVLVNDFRDHTMAKIRDIEDLGLLGREIGICPYYASRDAIKPSEIVTLPYPLLLQKSAREALGISLKDHVVIMDEAHNLVDAISNIHSVSVSLSQLSRSRSQLGVYLQKFRNRLRGKNRVYITQLVRLLDSLTTYLRQKSKAAGAVDTRVDVNALLDGKGVDQINIYKLSRYLQDSHLARKVDGYDVHVAEQSVGASQNSMAITKTKPSSTMPVLTHVSSFLLAVMNPSAEGCFFCSKSNTGLATDITLEYLLLDPTKHFNEIVQDARAVILAGGTLSPLSDYKQSLVPDVSPSRISHLSCNHVIPISNLVAAPVDSGPNGVLFDFTFGSRGSSEMIQELGRAIMNLASTVPDGMVVFFPSYAYLKSVIQQWQKITLANGDSKTIWSHLSASKQVFLEPGASNDNASTKESSLYPKQSAESILSAYSDYIANNSPRGALLFAVISGSLSEGINFSDRLGRLICVVGLPFPNASSPSWRAKLDFIKDRARLQAAGQVIPASHNFSDVSHSVLRPEAVQKSQHDASKAEHLAAQEHTLATTMRAVNQSIGRAIRHKEDWAGIVLLDNRYGRSDVLEKLPLWIARSLMSDKTGRPGGRKWHEVMERLGTFYRSKKEAMA